MLRADAKDFRFRVFIEISKVGDQTLWKAIWWSVLTACVITALGGFNRMGS